MGLFDPERLRFWLGSVGPAEARKRAEADWVWGETRRREIDAVARQARDVARQARAELRKLKLIHSQPQSLITRAARSAEGAGLSLVSQPPPPMQQQYKREVIAPPPPPPPAAPSPPRDNPLDLDQRPWPAPHIPFPLREGRAPVHHRVEKPPPDLRKEPLDEYYALGITEELREQLDEETGLAHGWVWALEEALTLLDEETKDPLTPAYLLRKEARTFR